MFTGRIVSRSNINGKVHTFQKDFDDYDTYQKFIAEHPEYSNDRLFPPFLDPWSALESWMTPLDSGARSRLTPPVETRYLPDGVDLTKYQTRQQEKRISDAEKARKRQSLERSRDYLQDYLDENPDDTEARADIEKIESEIKSLA